MIGCLTETTTCVVAKQHYVYVHKNLTPIVGWSIKMKAQIQSLIEKYLKDEGVCAP